MKQGGKEARGGEAERQEEMEEGQKVDNKVRRGGDGDESPSLLHNTVQLVCFCRK